MLTVQFRLNILSVVGIVFNDADLQLFWNYTLQAFIQVSYTSSNTPYGWKLGEILHIFLYKREDHS